LLSLTHSWAVVIVVVVGPVVVGPDGSHVTVGFSLFFLHLNGPDAVGANPSSQTTSNLFPDGKTEPLSIEQVARSST